MKIKHFGTSVKKDTNSVKEKKKETLQEKKDRIKKIRAQYLKRLYNKVNKKAKKSPAKVGNNAKKDKKRKLDQESTAVATSSTNATVNGNEKSIRGRVRVPTKRKNETVVPDAKKKCIASSTATEKVNKEDNVNSRSSSRPVSPLTVPQSRNISPISLRRSSLRRVNVPNRRIYNTNEFECAALPSSHYVSSTSEPNKESINPLSHEVDSSPETTEKEPRSNRNNTDHSIRHDRGTQSNRSADKSSAKSKLKKFKNRTLRHVRLIQTKQQQDRLEERRKQALEKANKMKVLHRRVQYWLDNYRRILGTDKPSFFVKRDKPEHRQEYFEMFSKMADIDDVANLKFDLTNKDHIRVLTELEARGAVCLKHNGILAGIDKRFDCKSWPCQCVAKKTKPKFIAPAIEQLKLGHMSEEQRLKKQEEHNKACFRNAFNEYGRCRLEKFDVIKKEKEGETYEKKYPDHGKMAQDLLDDVTHAQARLESKFNKKKKTPVYNATRRKLEKRRTYVEKLVNFQNNIIEHCYKTKHAPIIVLDWTGLYDPDNSDVVPEFEWSEDIHRSEKLLKILKKMTAQAKEDKEITLIPNATCDNDTVYQSCHHKIKRAYFATFDADYTLMNRNGVSLMGVDSIPTPLTKAEQVTKGVTTSSCTEACKCNLDTCSHNTIMRGSRYGTFLFRTPQMGWAVFAAEPIQRGTYMAQVAGDACLAKEMATNGADPKMALDVTLNEKTDQMMTYTSHKQANLFRFFNHGCCPNMTVIRVIHERGVPTQFDRVALVTRQRIEMGEELVYVYNQEAQRPSQNFRCDCPYYCINRK